MLPAHNDFTEPIIQRLKSRKPPLFLVETLSATNYIIEIFWQDESLHLPLSDIPDPNIKLAGFDLPRHRSSLIQWTNGKLVNGKRIEMACTKKKVFGSCFAGQPVPQQLYKFWFSQGGTHLKKSIISWDFFDGQRFQICNYWDLPRDSFYRDDKITVIRRSLKRSW